MDGLAGAKEFLKIAPAPDWLVKKLIRNGSQKQQNRAPDTEEKWTEGRRNDKLFRLACSLRRQGMTVEEITTVLIAANRAHCQPPLPDSEVADIALSSGRYPRGEQPQAEQTPPRNSDYDWPEPQPASGEVRGVQDHGVP